MSPKRQDEAGTDPYVPGHGDATFAVRHYDLELDYRMSSNRLVGRARLEVTTRRSVGRLELDLAGGLTVAKVTVGGRAAKYQHRGDRLRIALPDDVAKGTDLEVVVRYAGNPTPLKSDWGSVGWEELEDGVIVASQPSGAPSWYPCNDHPRDKATYAITVIADSPYTVIANGTLRSRKSSGSRTTWRYEQPEPMASYLAAVHVGQYDVIEVPGDGGRQRAALPKGLRERFTTDFGRQPAMMRLFEELFGPYPFGHYTVVVTADDLEIPLEAQGMSTFGANYVDGKRTEERLVAHELAHQWFGNSLTVGNWRDIWLNEGFACYAEWLWAARADDVPIEESVRKHHQRLARLDQDFAIADPGPELMFDDRLYKRGAVTLHAIRCALGDETFFDMLRDWVATHRHGNVTTELFREHVRGFHRGEGVDELFSAWLVDTDLPPLPTPERRAS
ncbi:M1 family metallopeptidase [Janibacter sp. G56]|uniref:M1 family metallopeptidase n=1 Tax=Janibacter sp. G56 TaxID=3418717 RepID=UPI003D0169C7